MGEYAEMMLEGICCEACGEFIGNEIGYARYCSPACTPVGFVSEREQILRDRHRRSSMAGMAKPRAKKAARIDRERHEAAKSKKPFPCPHCQNLFRTENGMHEHRKVVHTDLISTGRT